MSVMFKQRHFEALAQLMQDLRPSSLVSIERGKGKHAQYTLTLNSLGNLFARDNPMFDRGRFERACRPGANVRNRKN